MSGISFALFVTATESGAFVVFAQGEVVMKRELESIAGNAKVTALAGSSDQTLLPGKTRKRPDLPPAPPPVWTRYIDSRLKQFCLR